MWKRPDRDDPTGAACVIDSGGSSGRRRMGCRKQPVNKRPVRLTRSKGCKAPCETEAQRGLLARWEIWAGSSDLAVPLGDLGGIFRLLLKAQET